MGKKRNTTPALESRALDTLTEHPQQHTYNRDLADHAIQTLADDLKRNGQREPIQILPDGTILDGCQRRRALLLNGETHARVMVRWDLADADEATIEMRFLEFNPNRRQLDPLESARTAIRQAELAAARPRSKFFRREEEHLCGRLGKILNMCGRNLQRYLHVLEAPLEVQEAFRTGGITLTDASRVINLPDAQQEELVALLREDGDPRPFLDSIFRAESGRHRRAPDALNALRKDLDRGLADLAGREEGIAASTIREWLPTLEQAHALLGRLIDRARTDRSGPPSERLRDMARKRNL
jgi:hypothetical protein